MKHLPRRGQYELFSYGGKLHCFDDPGLDPVRALPEMFEWVRAQDPALWYPLKDDPDSNAALYLQPELYLLWKLRWACF